MTSAQTDDLKQFIQTTVTQQIDDVKQFVDQRITQSAQQQLDDLKQFVDGRISQTEARLDGRMDQLEENMNQGFAGVGDAIEQIHTQLSNHETRITMLENSTTTR